MKKENMLSLIEELNKATEAYDKGQPLMSDKEWDNKYFELEKMERYCNYAYPHSPTQSIYYKEIDKLIKTEHNHPMLSLAKTKKEEDILNFVKNKEYITMLKMDGLTCSLLYEKGKLIKAETRGNGQSGEDITHNAMIIPTIPKHIDYLDTLIVDGEIICNLQDFEDYKDKYANPRNFAAGSIRLLNNKECAKRHLTFIAWDWINSNKKTLVEKLNNLWAFGFTTVPYITNSFNIEEMINTAKKFSYPIDGLVVKFNDCAYYNSLGRTDHHYKGGLAFKFADDSIISYLEDIDYEVSRNGVLTPVAVFEPVELEGSVINRASLHNLTVLRNILGDQPYKGQELEIIKANMIIPQIISSEIKALKLEDYPNKIFAPTHCPSCGELLVIECENESEILKCKNENCPCRLINQMEHFFSKKGIEAKGLSKGTLEKLLNWGWIENISDVFELKKYQKDWCYKPGFGIKSVDNILKAIEASRHCDLDRFIVALGIPLIGTTAAKDLTKIFNTWEQFINAVEGDYKFYDIPNFGLEMHYALKKFNYTEAKELVNKYIIFNSIDKNLETTEKNLKDQVFVITGKTQKFKNRDELKNLIESLGGKVTSAVSKNTTYLINNDIDSDSSKNQSAKKLNIPIINEEKFLEIFNI